MLRRAWSIGLMALAVIAAPWGSAALADPPADDLAVRFGARPSVLDIAMSPDGNRLAIVAPLANEGAVLYTTDLRRGPDDRRVALRSEGGRAQLRDCGWLSNERLFCYVISRVQHEGAAWVNATTIIAVDHDGANQQTVTRRSGDSEWAQYDGGRVIDLLPAEDGAMLITRRHVPDRMRSRLGVSVQRIDTRTTRSTSVEPIVERAADYFTDGYGAVRIMERQPDRDVAGYWEHEWTYQFRRPGSGRWEPLSTYNSQTGAGFRPVAVDRDLNLAYGFDVHEGRSALFSVALDGTGARNLVRAHPQVDVDGLIRIGRSRRVVGVSFATDKRHSEYFDPEIRRLRAALGRALPDLHDIWIVDSSLDESKLLVFASSDQHPGTYFVYDKATRRLDAVAEERPIIADFALSEVRPVTVPAADGTPIPAYLTLPREGTGRGLPAIVMPHGGPSARDEWGFDWLAQYYAARGYAVIQPNFRGSSGYGEDWLDGQGFLQWRVAIGDVSDAGRWLVREGIADADRLAIVGWSYGGYAALLSAAVDPALFKAVVAIAPVTDLPDLVASSRTFINHRAVAEMVGTGRGARDGSPARRAEEIRSPVLLIHGTQDGNVDVRHSRTMARALDRARRPNELIVYPDLDHQLNDSPTRADMLRRSDAFLRRAFETPSAAPATTAAR